MMLRTLTLASRFRKPLRRFLRLAWLGRLPLDVAGWLCRWADPLLPAAARPGPRPTLRPACEALEDRQPPDDVRSLLAGGVLFGGALLDSPLLAPAAALTQPGEPQDTPVPAVVSLAPAAGPADGAGDWQAFLAAWQTSTQAQGRAAPEVAGQPTAADQVFAAAGPGGCARHRLGE